MKIELELTSSECVRRFSENLRQLPTWDQERPLSFRQKTLALEFGLKHWYVFCTQWLKTNYDSKLNKNLKTAWIMMGLIL